jgi:D-alanyl-D-alanine carboxypeptidase
MSSGRLRNALTAITGLGLLVLSTCVRAAGTPGVAAKCPNKGPTRPAVCASAYYILDESDFTVLAARNSRVAAPIASITKLMTSLVVLEAGLPLEEMIFIERQDVLGTAGTASRLAPGTRLSRADLLHLALMSSEPCSSCAVPDVPGRAEGMRARHESQSRGPRHDDSVLQ